MPRARELGATVAVGLIETIRARGGHLPWLGRHLARLHASAGALGAPEAPADLIDLVRFAAGSGKRGDRVVRLQLAGGHAEIATRDVNTDRGVAVVVSREVHVPYPHKTTRREQFGRALAGARRRRAHDAVLVTAEGYVAEGTAWNLFWWDNGSLCTPAASLGILPGVGRDRILELSSAREAKVRPEALAGRSLFLVNAVRGVVEIGSYNGTPVPRDPRTRDLAASFWPD